MTDGPIAKIRAHVQPRWDDERAARLRLALERRARRRRVLRSTLTAVAAASTFVVLALLPGAGGCLLRPRAPLPIRPRRRPPSTPTRCCWPSQAQLGAGFTLEKGGARFVVAHDDSRPFRLRTGVARGSLHAVRPDLERDRRSWGRGWARVRVVTAVKP